MAKLTKRDYREIATGLAFLLPNLLGFLSFTLIPLVISLFMAFTDWNLEMHNLFQDNELHAVGLDNFIRLFSDPDFFTYLGNTLFLMMGIPFGVAGSLGAALLLNNDFRGGRTRQVYGIVIVTVVLTVSCAALVLTGMGAVAMTMLVCGTVGVVLLGGSIGGQTVYRTLFYFPSFTAGVATYILWKKLYSPENGPINNALQPVLTAITPWFSGLTPRMAMFAAAAAMLLMVLVYLVALWRAVAAWRNGELGCYSLMMAVLLLSLPLLLCQHWSRLSWGGALGATGVVLGMLVLARGLYIGRDFTALRDYGMGNAVVLDGLVMIMLFALLGTANVITIIPEAASSATGFSAPEWLSDYYWAKPAIMIMGFWGALGSKNMLLYLAGLSGVSRELYEAADIDGASPLQRFWNVTWPQLANVTFFILVMAVMHGLQGGFEMARTMTKGGPAGSTTTLAYYIYTEGFTTGNLGYASAVAWTLFALVFSVTLFNWKFGNKYTNE